MNKDHKQLREIIQKDLDDGKFGMICTNETSFMEYIISKLDAYANQLADERVKEAYDKGYLAGSMEKI